MTTVSYGDATQLVDLEAYWGDLEEAKEDLKLHFAQHLTLR